MRKMLIVLGAAIACTANAAPQEPLWSLAQKEKPAAVETLRALVNIESPSRHETGLRELGDHLSARLSALGANVERVPARPPAQADHIVGRITGSGTVRILLMAHMDTIYPVGTLAKRQFRVEGERAYGPGVADAKGGIAVILHALEVLQRLGFKDYAQITVLFNTDEEIGSVDSGPLVTRLAGEVDAVLSFEPSTAGKEVIVQGTGGVGEAIVTVRGRAAHAGVEPERGRSALVEASDIVLRTQDTDDRARAFRFNWTQLSSGKIRNQIPEEATLSADVRFFSRRLLDEKLAVVRERLAKKRVPDTEAELKFVMGRPPYEADEPSRALIERAVAIYKEVDGVLHVIPRTTGGTDAGYAQQAGRPVVETLGLPGFGYHSSQEEYGATDRIGARIYLAARMIIELAARGIPR